MSCTLRDLAAAVDRLAPFKLAYDWDNVGLQVGDPAAKVSRVLVCLELNANVIKEATTRKCQAIITHHPAVFKALKSLRSDNPSSQLVMELVRRDMGLIVAHTNLDRVKQGTNGVLADLLGLRDTLVLEPASAEAFYKFTVFVPREYTPKIIEAIHRGGGGRIGNYSHCTFRVSGTGTYIPEAGSTPFAGHIGHLEQADEEKLESIVPFPLVP